MATIRGENRSQCSWTFFCECTCFGLGFIIYSCETELSFVGLLITRSCVLKENDDTLKRRELNSVSRRNLILFQMSEKAHLFYHAVTHLSLLFET